MRGSLAPSSSSRVRSTLKARSIGSCDGGGADGSARWRDIEAPEAGASSQSSPWAEMVFDEDGHARRARRSGSPELVRAPTRETFMGEFLIIAPVNKRKTYRSKIALALPVVCDIE